MVKLTEHEKQKIRNVLKKTLRGKQFTYAESVHFEAVKALKKAFGSLDLRNKVFLDVGCEHGSEFSWILKAFGARVVGIDLSEAYLPEAKEGGILVVKANARRLPFKNNFFHGVFSGALFQDAVDKGFTNEILSEMHRVLKPGGNYLQFTQLTEGVGRQLLKDTGFIRVNHRNFDFFGRRVSTPAAFDYLVTARKPKLLPRH